MLIKDWNSDVCSSDLANGKSTVLYDGPPQSIHHVTNTKVGQLEMQHVDAFPAEVPEGHCCAVDIWETTGVPHMGDPDPMGVPRAFSIEPEGDRKSDV